MADVTPKFQFIRFFDELRIEDIPLVGGKNASLGEMYQELVPKGVPVPNGFAITAEAYRYVIEHNDLWPKLHEYLDALNPEDPRDLQMRGALVRDAIYGAQIPDDLFHEMVEAYNALVDEYGSEVSFAVRSSATAEDLPTASFAGQQDTYLNISGLSSFIDACKRCFASLFTDRAIHYRIDQGFDHFEVALSIGVQLMVRSDLASSGVMFTIDTETGFKDVMLITGAYGLGENVVQGVVDPDEFYVHKPTFDQGYRKVLKRHLGAKKIKMVYSSDSNQRNPVRNVPTSNFERQKFCISDKEVLQLAGYAGIIEKHYSAKAGKLRPMDIEWAKDGQTGELFIVQARPETVASQKRQQVLEQYKICDEADLMAPIVTGRSVGAKIAFGRARVIESIEHLNEFQPGEVLVSDITTPDWEPVMKIASALVTNRGGRTCHAAIIARELGIPAVVGTESGTEKIKTGEMVTISCAQGDLGRVYGGQLRYEVEETDLSSLEEPETEVMLNVGNPEIAFQVNTIPNAGVGLARMEFIINNEIKVHPLALLQPDKVTSSKVAGKIDKLTEGYANGSEYFVRKLSEGIGTLAAGFYPKPVVLRLSDFKSNEYANLIGGKFFEEREENPMIGFRGASRYNDEEFAPAFALECQAIKQVREQMGMDNVIVMVPFCRRVEEAKAVIDNLSANGLVRGQNGLKVYMMCEIPNNVLMIDEFSEYFDGFSIGTNDLTQLVLGVDRDSGKVAYDYDERDPGVKKMVRWAVEGAKRNGKHISLCGQAPSDFPDFAEFLVELGIDAMSLNPDSVLKTLPLILKAESKGGGAKARKLSPSEMVIP
ncbi:phosphoenolpyruvate synthase [Thiomicrorhabdus xiamenensis]|uniref:Phosphoenolpyruvate synthase n=1 Tax=Thiomicrorhabdus xiamenensis TaxID=2739063 RepID=A0A7D4TDK0_9GAMM|nr:phosphoenolpyruvate synthase [Thiomicrorhabdus xiamenensis]QKI88687.1 phosphoenolpyruvate synthase [Thiomicrorhabdus xiamenensis]